MAKQTKTFPDDEFFKTHTAASFQRLLGINNGNPEIKKTSFLARFIKKHAPLCIQQLMDTNGILTYCKSGAPSHFRYLPPTAIMQVYATRYRYLFDQGDRELTHRGNRIHQWPLQQLRQPLLLCVLSGGNHGASHRGHPPLRAVEPPIRPGTVRRSID